VVKLYSQRVVVVELASRYALVVIWKKERRADMMWSTEVVRALGFPWLPMRRSDSRTMLHSQCPPELESSESFDYFAPTASQYRQSFADSRVK
jgi:hypothetical protein